MAKAKKAPTSGKPSVTKDQQVLNEEGKGQTPGTTQNAKITDLATEGDSEERAAEGGREPVQNGRDRHWTQESKARWDEGQPSLADMLNESRANDEEAAAAREE